MKISDLLRDFADTHLLRGIADAVDQQEEEKSDDKEGPPVTTVVSPAATVVPAATTLLTSQSWRCNNATAAVAILDICSIYLETDQ